MKTVLFALLGLGALGAVIYLARRKGQGQEGWQGGGYATGVPVGPIGQNPKTAQGGETETQAVGKMLGIPGAKYIDRLDTKVGQPIRQTTSSVNDFINNTILGGGRDVGKVTEVWHAAAVNSNQAKNNLRRSQLNKAPGRYSTVTINKRASFSGLHDTRPK